MSLEDCLPPHLRGPGTTITRTAAGFSGAGVYRVDAAGQAFVLKIAGEEEPVDRWRRKLHVQQLAANAGLAPAILHVDEGRRAVVSAFVVDRSFPALYADPRTRGPALEQLGQTLRRVHELPLPDTVEPPDPLKLLTDLWSKLANTAVPDFVGDAVRRVLTEEPPPREGALVLSHNDVNPTNLVYDGKDLLLLDWETAGPNDRFYDPAAISVFLNMDEAACRDLLGAQDGHPVASLPPRFSYNRRLVAVLCGAVFLTIARQSGYAGAADQTLDSAPALGDFYQRLRSGQVNLGTAEGRWLFGLALLKTATVSL